MSNLITISDPHSAVAEAYQSLRTSIEFTSLGEPLHVLLLASADDSVNKSLAVANLAVAMAQAGDRVIVIDGDLRKPRQHELFGLDNQKGLSTWLTKGGSAPLQKTSFEKLQVLCAGPVAQNPVALLSVNRLGEVLAEMRKQADYVLCDAPPLLAVTDGALWASKVDGVVLVVSAGATRREYAQRAKSLLERIHARIVGAVLLDAEMDRSMERYGAQAG